MQNCVCIIPNSDIQTHHSLYVCTLFAAYSDWQEGVEQRERRLKALTATIKAKVESEKEPSKLHTCTMSIPQLIDIIFVSTGF